jgi:uncharacterized repeat protein (TIGR03803 family)
LYSFCSKRNCSDGIYPYSGLIQATDGDLYGTTSLGGAQGFGTVYKISLTGKLTTIYSFCSQPSCADGGGPMAGLLQAPTGKFYGTTNFGGATCSNNDNCGTVFELTPAGKLTTLHSFCSQTNCSDGLIPFTDGLVQAADGSIYGATMYGGVAANCLDGFGCGTIFKVFPTGELTTIYNFCALPGCADGAGSSGLVQGTNGNFYATTESGGQNGYGTFFEITPSGKLTTLYSFCPEGNCSASGFSVGAALAQARDGNFFYGSAQNGGANGYGAVFKITPAGELTVLHSFDVTRGGIYGGGGLVQATDMTLYGTTMEGGIYPKCPGGCGTVFGVSVSARSSK